MAPGYTPDSSVFNSFDTFLNIDVGIDMFI